MQNFSHPVSPGYRTTGTCNRAFQAGRREIIVGRDQHRRDEAGNR